MTGIFRSQKEDFFFQDGIFKKNHIIKDFKGKCYRIIKPTSQSGSSMQMQDVQTTEEFFKHWFKE